MPEYLLYGLPQGETERYKETLLYSQGTTPEALEPIKLLAAKDGFHSFRVSKFEFGEKPDFTRCLA